MIHINKNWQIKWQTREEKNIHTYITNNGLSPNGNVCCWLENLSGEKKLFRLTENFQSILNKFVATQ